MYAFVTSLGKLLKLNTEKEAPNNFIQTKRKMVIPLYQREYKWPNEKICGLINDINLRDKFLGNVIMDELDDHYEIDEKTMVDIMVISKKDIKNNLLENWKNLKRLTAHPKLGKIATMLVDGHPLVVSQKVMVLEYQSDNVVEKMNLIRNQKDIQNVIRTVFGKKMFIYAVNRKGSIDLQQKFMNLLQLSRLPKADTIQIDFIGD